MTSISSSLVQNSLVAGLVNISSKIAAHYSSRFSLGAGMFCAIAATECFIRIFKDLYDMNQDPSNVEFKSNLSANLGGCIFYGLMATNVIPYTAIIGAGMFTIYSIRQGRSSPTKPVDNYFLTRAIQTLTDTIIIPILTPIVEKISRVVEFVFNHLITPIVKAIGNLIGHLIPNHPIWIGVAALVTAIVAYHFAIAPII